VDIRGELLRRRKDNRWIIGALGVLLLILSGILFIIQRGRGLPTDQATNRVLLFALWYLNLVLIITIIFVLLRNLFKLLVERHQGIFGSKLRTKLVATYIGLSLVPVLLLFVYGSQLLQGWIDNWFNEPAIKKVMEQGYDVAQALYEQAHSRNRRDARRVLNEIEGLDLQDPGERPALDRRLQQLLAELELDFLSVYRETDFVSAVVRPQSGIGGVPDHGERFLLEALDRGEGQRVLPMPEGQGRVLLAAVAGAEPAEGRPVVVTGSHLDASLATQSEQLIQAFQGYRQLEVRKSDIKTTYRLTFLLVTLMILLATSWVGLLLARRVTVPIEAVAEGTRRLSEGDLDHQVEVPADDELGVLVRSFNRMTTELRRNKEELVSANRNLAEERAVIAAVLQNLAAGVISVDQEGRILTCNRVALTMLRQDNEPAVGRPVAELWQDPERRKLAELFEEDPGPVGRISRGLRLFLGGEWKTFEAKVRTMRDREGQVSGRVMVLEDLTELISAQQMAAWNDAARRVAHEIKNPLTPIKLAAERLLVRYKQQDDNLGEALEEGVETIVREVDSMRGMVDDFSRFARMRPPQPTQVNMRRLVEETLSLYGGLKPGVDVDSTVDDGAESAIIDGEQMRRVLINLIDNAIEATEPPGQVTVHVHSNNGSLEIDVADTGAGIPPEAQEKLFLPHFSTKRRGTGLGLSIVYRIVNEHHGTIRVENNQPQGTVFKIELPQG
jgi:two-component system nitrogen regulation sensor histidine kinase NtrY